MGKVVSEGRTTKGKTDVIKGKFKKMQIRYHNKCKKGEIYYSSMISVGSKSFI